MYRRQYRFIYRRHKLRFVIERMNDFHNLWVHAKPTLLTQLIELIEVLKATYCESL